METYALPADAAASVSLMVLAADTALAMHSGGLPVLATPRMIALMEEAAVAAVAPYLPPGVETVGTRVDVRHLAATPIGGAVIATAQLVEVDRRRLVFAVSASDEAGEIGNGVHERHIVESGYFLSRAQGRRAR